MFRGQVEHAAPLNGILAALTALLVALIVPVSTAAAATHHTSKWSAHGSAEQVYVLGLHSGARASLISPSGRVVATKRADSLGGLLFRNVHPGRGYRVKLDSTGAKSDPITVHSDAAKPWDPGVYKQTIQDHGYQYLTTRDGTKLAIYVHPPTDVSSVLPNGVTLPVTPPGPRPTLIEYSGYGYARPPSEGGAQNSIELLANVMGFTVVDVNMRGTGCSGGAYNFFEPLQNLDGYDVIETIAHQSWVLDHKVGMMGISYGGISQLFTAQLRPPALEAIAPLSVIDATATTLYPGGILNTGFAVAWALQRQYEARPAGPHGGQAWASDQIHGGDKTCKRNQVLHGEAANLPAKIRTNDHYRPKVADPLDPISFVHKIKVPVFMACQFEDEQTGGHCPDLTEHLTGTKLKWFNFTNGAHIDSIDPYTYDHWYDFLELFVAHQAPGMNPYFSAVQGSAPAVYMAAMGTNDYQHDTLPADPIQSIPSYSAALAAFKKIPEIRILFDNGGGKSPDHGSKAGDPYPIFIRTFPKFPIPGTKPQFWYFRSGGKLGSKPPKHQGVNWYTSNAKALPLNDYKGNTGTGGLWANASQWAWRWKQNPAGTAVSYVSAPLKKSTVVIGPGAVHVWAKSSTPNVDVQATVSEVRSDGKETFVQDGWIRANERKLDPKPNNILKQRGTLLAPVPSMKPADVQAMPKNRFVELVIPLYYEGHAYRKGSRIRVTIAAPNGTQPIWSFDKTAPKGTAKVSVAFSKSKPSSLVLPVVPGVSVPGGYPPCPGLRNEPCRPYKAFKNRTASSSHSKHPARRARTQSSGFTG
jgi:predicted acyl esterase